MKKAILFIGLILSFVGHSQSIEKGDSLKISNFIGLDSLRTEFIIEKVSNSPQLGGYLIVFNENNTFDVFGYGFCGVGEKAFVKGNYSLEGDSTLKLHFQEVIYRNMGKETRRNTIEKEVIYEYDLESKMMIAIQ